MLWSTQRNQALAYCYVDWTNRSKVPQALSTIDAFIIIGLSKFSGSRDPCLADIHVIRTSEVPDSTYGELVELSTKLTREMDVGYTDCIVSVAVSCNGLINVLTSRHQFTAAGAVPKSVRMANDIGLVDSEVLIRNIAPPSREVSQRPGIVLHSFPRRSYWIISCGVISGCGLAPWKMVVTIINAIITINIIIIIIIIIKR